VTVWEIWDSKNVPVQLLAFSVCHTLSPAKASVFVPFKVHHLCTTAGLTRNLFLFLAPKGKGCVNFVDNEETPLRSVSWRGREDERPGNKADDENLVVWVRSGVAPMPLTVGRL